MTRRRKMRPAARMTGRSVAASRMPASRMPASAVAACAMLCEGRPGRQEGGSEDSDG